MESPFMVDIVKGKVALITGGGSGIGFEITKEFGRHGASVAIMGRRKSVLDSAVSSLRSLGIQAIGFVGDVRNNEDASRVVDSTFAYFGSIDILVNADAGIFLCLPRIYLPMDLKQVFVVMDIDTVGTFRMCHEAFKYIKKGGPGREDTSGGGTILNGSATLHYSATWYQIHVSAAKAAIHAMTRSLALEWGTDYGIRVNGIAPGPIGDTPGLSKFHPHEMKTIQSGAPTHQIILGEKWDIAMAALYLDSDAGKHINGTILVVDGGDWFNRAPHVSKEAVKELSRSVEKRSRSGAPPPESGVPTRSKM